MRKDGWDIRLYDVFERAKDEHFRWGVFDCFTFAADCVRAITGVDPMAKLRGTYSTQNEAYRLICSLGGVDRALDDFLPHSVRTAPQKAHRGAIVMQGNQPLGTRLCVLDRDRMYCPYENGGIVGIEIGGTTAWDF